MPVDETQRDTRRSGLLASLPTLELVAVDGPSRGTRVTVVGNRARIGSAPVNVLVLDDPSVSRIHCEIQVGLDALTLVDLGSTNGTFLGQVRVHRADVPLGTSVAVGGSTFRIEEGQGAPSLLLSSRRSYGPLIGASVPMRAVYAMLERLQTTDTTVLLLGETGTGKDVAARALHEASRRSASPFHAVDCGAIPEHLFESELFGHVRGSFTGAVSHRAGAFEAAHGGTLFLDEIGELPLPMQAKLLRALETRSVRRVGSNVAIPYDVRIVAATNVNLAEMVNRGTFREDLYYRLAVVEVPLPPLRERRGDVALLARLFHEQLTGSAANWDPAIVARFESRAWPGNVRELRNAVERAIALGQLPSATGQACTQPELAADGAMRLHLPLKEARDAWNAHFEQAYVRGILQRAGGNVTHAAALAGVSRRFLQRTLVRLGFARSSADDDDASD